MSESQDGIDDGDDVHDSLVRQLSDHPVGDAVHSRGFLDFQIFDYLSHFGRRSWIDNRLIVVVVDPRLDIVFDAPRVIVILAVRAKLRSEEHTSELQSRFDLVCRLLLEKKKKKKYKVS